MDLNYNSPSSLRLHLHRLLSTAFSVLWPSFSCFSSWNSFEMPLQVPAMVKTGARCSWLSRSPCESPRTKGTVSCPWPSTPEGTLEGTSTMLKCIDEIQHAGLRLGWLCLESVLVLGLSVKGHLLFDRLHTIPIVLCFYYALGRLHNRRTLGTQHAGCVNHRIMSSVG